MVALLLLLASGCASYTIDGPLEDVSYPPPEENPKTGQDLPAPEMVLATQRPMYWVWEESVPE